MSHQDRFINYLQQKRQHHGLLISGEGDAYCQQQLALQWVKKMFCLSVPLIQPNGACDRCMNCRRINHFLFPDVLWLGGTSEETDGESHGVLSIEKIRELGQSFLIQPSVGGKRVAILIQAHRMSLMAANAFLKVLEEPPSYLQIWLLTEKPYALPLTIRSRCLLFPHVIQSVESEDEMISIEEALSLLYEKKESLVVGRVINQLKRYYRVRVIDEKEQGMRYRWLNRFDELISLEGKMQTQADAVLQLEAVLRGHCL